MEKKYQQPELSLISKRPDDPTGQVESVVDNDDSPFILLRSGIRAGGREIIKKVRTKVKEDTSENIDDQEAEDVPPLYNSVLEAVFRFLDFESLKTCRLVDRNWEEEASRTLPKRSCIRIKDWNNCGNEETKRLKLLKETLESSLNPHRIFTNLATNSADWLIDESPGLLDLLRIFGHHLKSIELTKLFHIYRNQIYIEEATLKNLARLSLVLNSWCPNIQSLTINVNMEYDGRQINIVDLAPNTNTIISTSARPELSLILKRLTTLTLSICIPETVADYFISLLKNSSSLRILKIVESPRPAHLSYLRFDENVLFKKLAENPEIGERLQEFAWCMLDNPNGRARFEKPNVYHILESILKMEFSNKLTTLRLQKSKDRMSREGLLLIRLLQKVAGSLETLELTGNYAVVDKNDKILPYILDIDDFPSMLRLKVLKISSKNAYGVPSISVLQKYPSLETFWLDNQVHTKLLDEVRYEKGVPGIDGFLKDWGCFKDLPHTNLNRLYMADRQLRDINSLNCIAQSFPNLKCLYVGIQGSPKSPRNISLPTAVRIFSRMNDLKELVLYENGKSTCTEVYNSLVILKDFAKLEKFALTNRSAVIIVYARRMIESLSELHNIECDIYLCGFKVLMQKKNTNQKMVLKYAEENGISLEIFNSPYEFTFPNMSDC